MNKKDGRSLPLNYNLLAIFIPVVFVTIFVASYFIQNPRNIQTGLGAIPGDVNADGVVDIIDFQLLSNSFGKSSGQSGFNANADFNHDNVVDILDFQVLSNNFGNTSTSGTVTPTIQPVSSTTPVPTGTATKASLLRTVDTSLFASPAANPAPDPAGITYLPQSNTLLLSDSEVDEMTIYKGANVFETTLDGILIRATNTLSFSHEPTGVTINTLNNHIFYSDDNQKKIFEVDKGTDNILGTPDDKVTSFSVTGLGSTDPESVAYGLGDLFIASGADKKVFQTTLSGSLIKSFDTSVYASDLEGICYNSSSGTLFIVNLTAKNVIEVTLNGALIRKIDISAAKPVAPADCVIAPSSNPNDNASVKSLYIVDRGIDNGANPNENDGKMYEMSIAF